MEKLFRNIKSPGTNGSRRETIVTSAAIGVGEGWASGRSFETSPGTDLGKIGDKNRGYSRSA